VEINKVIKKAMIDKGVNSQRELSELSNVPEVTIKRVLNGSNTSLKTVDALLGCLGLKLCVVDD